MQTAPWIERQVLWANASAMSYMYMSYSLINECTSDRGALSDVFVLQIRKLVVNIL